MSLLRDIIKIHAEEAKTKRAMRILARQTWSIEFLQYLLLKAASKEKKELEMQIIGPDGQVLVMRTIDKDVQESKTAEYADDDILEHLDDDRAISEFIARHTTR